MQQGLLPEKKYLLSMEMNGHRSNGFLLLTVVIETAILSEMELADYFQRMEFFVEQVKEWNYIHSGS
ncbi:hypothetical protein ACWCRQ_22385 [Escherichia marmotae]|nr:hypothetical protein [Escherichia coli]